MEKSTNFLLGLGIGSAIGAVAYRYSRTAKCRRLKHKMRHKFHNIGEQASDLIDTAKEKISDAGSKIAEKVNEKSNIVAEKAEEAKEKVHAFGNDLKKAY